MALKSLLTSASRVISRAWSSSLSHDAMGAEAREHVEHTESCETCIYIYIIIMIIIIIIQ